MTDRQAGGKPMRIQRDVAAKIARVGFYTTVATGGIVGLAVGLSMLPLLTVVLVTAFSAVLGTWLDRVTTTLGPRVPQLFVMSSWAHMIVLWRPGLYLYVTVWVVVLLAWILHMLTKHLPEPPRSPGPPAIESIP